MVKLIFECELEAHKILRAVALVDGDFNKRK